MGFNSIVVRLKGAPTLCLWTHHGRFQFHSGSIKREHQLCAEYRLGDQFQFHSGSIKREIWKHARSRRMEFQFHSGSIKRTMEIVTVLLDQSFNSIVVRLKAAPDAFCDIRSIGFNSIVVRLKECFIPQQIPRFARFQFHSGSIKRWRHHLREGR